MGDETLFTHTHILYFSMSRGFQVAIFDKQKCNLEKSTSNCHREQVAYETWRRDWKHSFQPTGSCLFNPIWCRRPTENSRFENIGFRGLVGYLASNIQYLRHFSGPPLYGHIICRLVVQPSSVIYPIAEGVISVEHVEKDISIRNVRARLQVKTLFEFLLKDRSRFSSGRIPSMLCKQRNPTTTYGGDTFDGPNNFG